MQGPDLDKTELGPMAMTYEQGVGWVAEKLGSKNGHWKRLATNTKPKTREGSTPLFDLDPHIIDLKQRKNQKQKSNKAKKESSKDGGVVVAALQHRLAR